MFPAYGYTQACPPGRAQTSEGLPPEASPTPFLYETWPHHHGYAAPAQFHSCCNHNTYPGHYAYRPPYPYFPPPMPHPQHYGSYPVYPEPYPFHYTQAAQPRDFHCCGCHHQNRPEMKADKGVKIEQHESDAENNEDPLIPSAFNKIARIPPQEPHQSVERSLQDPRVWNESIRRMLEGVDERSSLEDVNCRKGPSVVIPQQDLKKNVGQQPKFPSGWMPVDVGSLQKLLQNENLRRDHDQPRNEIVPNTASESSKQHPLKSFPVIWLPSNNEEKDQTRSEIAPSTASESSKQRPFMSEQGGDHTLKSVPTVRVEGSERGKMSAEKTDKPLKNIPVKEAEEVAHKKAKNIEEKKSTENGAKRKPKFGPVCLRVEPLPKKKNGQKHTSENKLLKDTKNQEAEQERKSVEAPQRKMEINVLDLDGRSRSIEIEKPSKCAKEQKEAGPKAEVQEAVDKKPEEGSTPEKRILSGTEAATIIQSKYRGYEVRRFEPLKKMRQIANIRDEAAAVKSSIESGAISMDLKQKTALGETIMNLLLKLDTIQGLHPIIRDFRKSVVKELVNLQEMLDTIVIKQPDHAPEANKSIGTALHTPDESSQSTVITGAEARESEGHTAGESSHNSGLCETEDQHKVERAVESPGITEAKVKAKAGEIEVRTADESSMNSGLGRIEDQHGVEAEESANDQISTSEDLPVEEASTEPEVVGQQSSPVITKEASAEQVEQEPTPVMSEVHIDSVDQPNMEVHRAEKNQEKTIESTLAETGNGGSKNLLTETEKEEPDESGIAKIAEPVALKLDRDDSVEDSQVAESDIAHGVEAEESADDQISTSKDLPVEAHELVGQESSSVITEEASAEPVEQEPTPEMSEVHIDSVKQTDMEEDRAEKNQEKNVESTLAETGNEGSKNLLTETEIAEAVVPKSDRDDSGGELPMSETSASDIAHEVDAKTAKGDNSLTPSSFESASERTTVEESELMRKLLERLIESEKQQKEVISSLSEKLKELEGKLAKQKPKKNNKKMGRTRKAKVLMPRSCNTSDGFSKEGNTDLAS